MKKNTTNTKELILKTSEQLFAKYGYDATSVDKIAKKAKIPKSLIYYYFRSKKQILEELFSQFEKELISMKEINFKELFDNKKNISLEKIREILNITFPFLEKWKDIIKIALIEEIKYFSKGPIFKYFDINLTTALELYKKNNVKLNMSKENITSHFFMIFNPLIAYSLFVDEWCSHYNFDKEKVKEIITDQIIKYFKDLFLNI